MRYWKLLGYWEYFNIPRFSDLLDSSFTNHFFSFQQAKSWTYNRNAWIYSLFLRILGSNVRVYQDAHQLLKANQLAGSVGINKLEIAWNLKLERRTIWNRLRSLKLAINNQLLQPKQTLVRSITSAINQSHLFHARARILLSPLRLSRSVVVKSNDVVFNEPQSPISCSRKQRRKNNEDFFCVS